MFDKILSLLLSEIEKHPELLSSLLQAILNWLGNNPDKIPAVIEAFQTHPATASQFPTA